MSKVTSKHQVTVPRAIAKKYNIDPGVEIAWVEAGEIIHVIPPGRKAAPEGLEAKLRLFDQATARHGRKHVIRAKQRPGDRGWKREDLYARGRSR